MTKEQYNRAAELKANIRATERKINEANRIIGLRKNSGVSKRFWLDICHILWEYKEAREVFEKDIFDAIKGYRCKMQTQKEKLEKQFEEL